jgi:clan AA aspartic protease (TIGR02281 family)
MILTLDTVVNESGNCRQYALFHLGQIDKAITWSNKIIESFPTSGNYYDAACLYSLMNKPTESITSLKVAFENGYTEFVHLSQDDDLDNVRNLPEFKALVQQWQVKYNKSLSKEPEAKMIQKGSELFVEEPETAILPMKNISSGTYEIKCQINELPLNFLFDTGASDISISQTEVDFMLKNGFLNKTDVLGSQNYEYANGAIEVGTRIILRKVNLGGFILRNVSASVVLNKKAPLLIGQSALGKYGKIIIDNDKKTITISHQKK